MVSVGSKVLQSRRHKVHSSVEDRPMGEENRSHKSARRKQGMNRRAKEGDFGSGGDGFGKSSHGSGKHAKFLKGQDTKIPKSPIIRKQVDPMTTKYFSDIANLFESNEVELEERSVICGNALEETRGKEYELATDYIISHILQSLLEGCDVDHLCGFLRSCSRVFPLIAMDRSGSHVAETALRSIATHLQDEETYSAILETLTMICKVIVENPADLMYNCYGSHVLRRLLCLCKGVSLDSAEFQGTKSSTNVAERLNLKTSCPNEHAQQKLGHGFPGLLKDLITGMLNYTADDKSVLVDQFGSLVLQAFLKLLAGDDEELGQMIPILLGCNKENIAEGNTIETTVGHKVKNHMIETSYSHLLEVILEVAPEYLYDDMFNKIFRNSLFEMSSHQCGSFVVQALISKARHEEQMELIWGELGTKFMDLLEMGRSGVVASLMAASHRLHTHDYKCCQAIATAVCSADDPPACIVPRILFLDSYFRCQDQSSWKWPAGVKMHVMGSLILQAVFRCRNEYIQPFLASITSMEVDHLMEAAKDSAGAHVIEAFLDSSASGKHKRKLILKLQGHYGELSMHSSGYFTLEKCFTASNVSLREAIVSELSVVRNELSRTKHGPHLLRKLDIHGYASHPDQWRSRQASKQTAYNEFRAIFGSSGTKSSGDDSFPTDTNTSKRASRTADIKQMRKYIDSRLSSAAPSLLKFDFKQHEKRAEHHSYKGNDSKKRKGPGEFSSAHVASKATEKEAENERPFNSFDKSDKKRRRKDDPSKVSKKKPKK
ncbi:pumilio homolog 23 [Syzygium oleosum]|uniref:pumilio homolog 23 n=1 Tax=Syzygium oleosum TaxID=219896 RepID=UPI0024BBDFE7|nr:pumilio homolog 23 [Syzygium oleosum]